MNWSLEQPLYPKLTKFLEHVRTDAGNYPETWVQKALELSQPVHTFLANAMLSGFILSSDIQWALDKVLETLVMCKAKEEGQLQHLFPKFKFRNFDVKDSGVQLEILGLAPDANITQYLPASLLEYLAEAYCDNVRNVTLQMPSGYPMVYTLENLRRVLQNMDNIRVQWHGVDKWRPDMGLEVAVADINKHDQKSTIDLLIKNYLGDGSILYSRLDPSLNIYRVIIADPMKTDRILGRRNGGPQFRLLYHLMQERIPPEDRPIPLQLAGPLAARGVELKLPCGIKHYDVSVEDAYTLEKDLFFFIFLHMNYSIQQQFGPLHPQYYQDSEPRPIMSVSGTPSPMRLLHDALCNGNWPQFKDVVHSINNLISSLPQDGFLNIGSTPQKPLRDHILTDLYRRCVVPHMREIQLDTKVSGSTKEATYGVLHTSFVDKILQIVHLDKTSTFWDLGCGVGNVAVQVNLQTGCQSFGMEIVPFRVQIAKALVDEYKAACSMWGFSVGEVSIEHGDLREDRFWDLIKTADLILVNNLVFEPATNHILWEKLQSIKLGASVVALQQLEVDRRGGNLAHGLTSSGETTTFSITSIESSENEVSWHSHRQMFYIYQKVKEGDSITR